jgi:hypothetical protein
MNYDQVLKQLQTLLEIPLNQEDENFKRIVPLMFTYADNRIYRELEFIATTTVLAGTLTPFNRETPLPSTVVVLREMSVLVPTGYSWAGPDWQISTSRKTLERISPEALDMFWSNSRYDPQSNRMVPSPRGVPEKYAMVGGATTELITQVSYSIRLMPTPDKAYAVEYFGVIRPLLLSATNPETFLSVNYADLFCAACMVFASGYQRDFGAQADDPQKAMSWNGMYEALRASAQLEAGRMKGTVPAMGNPAAAGAG